MSDDFVSDSDLDDNYRTNFNQEVAHVELSDASFICSNKASIVENHETLVAPLIPENINLDQKLKIEEPLRKILEQPISTPVKKKEPEVLAKPKIPLAGFMANLGLGKNSTSGLGKNAVQNLLQKNLAKTMKKKNHKDINALTSQLDTQHAKNVSEEDQRSFRTAGENKEAYMSSYCQKFEIPSFYVQQATFYGPDPSYYFQIVHYRFPSGKTKVYDHFLESRKTHQLKNWQDLYDFKPGIYLRLMQQVNGEQKKVLSKEIWLGPANTRNFFKFSHDFSRFALFQYNDEKNDTIIKVYSLITPEQLAEKVKKDQTYIKFDTDIDFLDGKDYFKLEFDKHNLQIAAYGKQSVCLMDIENGNLNVYSIDKFTYEKIMQVKVLSDLENDGKVRCYVACKKFGMQQIHLFDINDKIVNPQKETSNLRLKEDPLLIALTERKMKKDKENAATERYGTPSTKEKREFKLFGKRPTIYFKEQVAIEKQQAQLKKEKIKIMNYNVPLSKYTKILISDDLERVVLANYKENFMMVTIDGKIIQKGLPHLNNKICCRIGYDDQMKEFMFVSSFSFDSTLQIQSSLRNDLLITFPRDVEPGLIKILDIYIQTQYQGENENSESSLQDKQINICGTQDNDFVIDTIKFNQRKNKEAKNEIGKTEESFEPGMEESEEDEAQLNINYDVNDITFESSRSVPIKCFSFNYPYVAFSGLKPNAIFLINAFKPEYVNRVIVQDIEPGTTFEIKATFVTQNLDLYILAKENTTYKLFKINMDDSNIMEIDKDNFDFDLFFKVNLLITFDASQVDNQMFKQMHIRGDTEKDVIDTNTLMSIWLVFGDKLYNYTAFNKKVHNVKIKYVSNIHSMLRMVDQNQFIFLEKTLDDEKQPCIVVKQIKIGFSFFFPTVLYKEISKDKILSFNLDLFKGIVFIFVKEWCTIKKAHTHRKIKMYDTNKNEIIFQRRLQHEQLVGLLTSGMYTLMDGHIYFSNDVIKIRYDQIEKVNGDKISESTAFDYINDIFDLGEGERVKSRTPLDSFKDHRMAYVTQDLEQFGIGNIWLLPYLHDRKIYLNQPKINTQYFYTIINTPLKDKNGKISDKETLTSIQCMNWSENKVYSYTQSGLLFNRIVYEHQTKRYGQAFQTSCCGQNYLFRKKIKDIQNENDFWSVHVFCLSIFNLQFIKTIDIWQEYQKLAQSTWLDELFQNERNEEFLEKLTNHVALIFQINENSDVCIQISQNQKYSHLYQTHETIYLFKNWNDGFDINNLDKEQLDRLEDQEKEYFIYHFKKKKLHKMKSWQMIDVRQLEVSIRSKSQIPSSVTVFSSLTENDKSEPKFYINNKYLFVYTESQIRYWDYSGGVLQERVGDNQIGILLNRRGKIQQSFVEIRGGSNPDMLVIVVDTNGEQHTIFEWDCQRNTEKFTTEIDLKNGNYQIVFDSEGRPMIIEKHRAVFNGLSNLVYKYDNEYINSGDTIFMKYNGYQLDGKNQNWFIIKKYLCLSYSYLSLVIREKIESNDKEYQGNVFDVEPYNIIFNGKSVFLDSKVVTSNAKQLQTILQNFEALNPILLELLAISKSYKDKQTQQQKFVTPLSKAVESGNQKTVNLILKYLAHRGHQVDTSMENKFLFPKLLEYGQFKPYLEALVQQTQRMSDKQILCVEDGFNDDIVAIESSVTKFVNNTWFKENFNEDKDQFPYSVDVKCIKSGWYLREEIGKQFLQTLIEFDDLSMYQIESLQMLIEFLYSQYRNFLFMRDLPQFLIRMTLFYTALLTNQSTTDESAKYNKVFFAVLFACYSIQAVMEVIAFFILRQQYTYDPETFIKNSECIVSAVIWVNYLFNIGAGYYQLNNRFFGIENEKDPETNFFSWIQMWNRLNNCVIIFLMVMQCFSFFQLNDDISPFIDIFFQIFYDIKYFMLVLIIFGFACANCFWLLSINQTEFDNLTSDEADSIGYSSLGSSGWYIWQMVLGGGDDSAFALGKSSQQYYLMAMYTISSFVMVFHLMNMLIAIMADTFAARTEISEQIRIRDHLKFVLKNMYLSEMAFTNKDKLKFIIVAFKDKEEQGGDIDMKIDSLRKEVMQKMEENTQMILNVLEKKHK